MYRRLIGTIAVLTITGTSAYCAPSGLNIIPTADIAAPGTVSCQLYQGGPLSKSTPATSYVFTQIGIARSMEFGYDSNTSDNTGVWNLKMAVAWHRTEPVAAVGIQCLGAHSDSQLYAVGHKCLGLSRLHMGLIQSDNTVRPMLGFDRPINGRMIFMADYIAGSENSANAGLCYDLGGGANVCAAYTCNNSGSGRSGFYVMFGRTLSASDMRKRP